MSTKFYVDAIIAGEELPEELKAKLKGLLLGLNIANYAAVFKDFTPGSSMSSIQVLS